MTGWRRQVTKKMPAGDAIFVGQNEGTSRCARTKCASPFVPGQRGTPAECFTKYVVWFHAGGQQELRAALPEIAGKELSCDCAPGQPCHADYLVTQARLAPARSAPAVQRRGRLLPQLVTPGSYINISFFKLAPPQFLISDGGKRKSDEEEK